MEQTKTCPRCKENKPLSGFHIDSKRKSGRQVTCAKCRSKAAIARYATDADVRKRHSEWAKNSRGFEYAARSAELKKLRPPTAHSVEAKRIAARLRKQTHKAEIAACGAVRFAVKTGKLLPARLVPCAVGGDCLGVNQWHHDSYLREDRLNVRCMCARHHKLWHKANSPKRDKQ